MTEGTEMKATYRHAETFRSWPRRQGGFTLVEAMVGVVIFSVGLLSLASLQGELLSSTGDSKARTEAAQLAEREVENLRAIVAGYASKDAFNQFMENQVANPPYRQATVNGTNASFALVSTIESGDADSGWAASVTVGWTPARGDAQQVALSTVIGWDSATAGARASGGAGMIPADPLISPPSGEARLGGRVYDDLPDGASLTDYGYYVNRHDDGATEWIADSGATQLTIDSGKDFVIIEGHFYPETSSGNTNFYPLATGASLCEYGYDATDLSKYFCVVGPGWYGSIGFVDGSERAYAGTCVGDPATAVANPEPLDTRTPIYTTVRMYRGNGPLGMQAGTTDRGYVVFSEDIYAEDDDGDGYPDVGAEQSFAHQTYNGNSVPDTAECRTTLEDLDPSFAGNAGRFVCLTDDCPDYSFTN